jgi:hypothetical protein
LPFGMIRISTLGWWGIYQKRAHAFKKLDAGRRRSMARLRCVSHYKHAGHPPAFGTFVSDQPRIVS